MTIGLLREIQRKAIKYEGNYLSYQISFIYICEKDGYLFAYGESYLTGLQDFALVAGTAPLLPRFTFGIDFPSQKN